jgi:hypothetical protein
VTLLDSHRAASRRLSRSVRRQAWLPGTAGTRSRFAGTVAESADRWATGHGKDELTRISHNYDVFSSALRLYLKAAKGDPVTREIRDPATGRIIERQTPSVVLAEHPPDSPERARANWREAKARLLSIKAEVDAELRRLEEARQICLQLPEARRDVANAEAAVADLFAERPRIAADLDRCRANVDAAGVEHVRRRDVASVFANTQTTDLAS